MRCPSSLLLLWAVTLAGCADAPPLTGQAQADAETRTACEQRAEAVYDQQNRSDIYAPPNPVNTPFSANYAAGGSNHGLSDVFAHDRLVSDCIRNKGTSPINTGTTPPPPPRPAR